ncbi:MAG: PilZ domain-containing protein, partial [Terracidiphilus sp.]
YWTGAAPQAHNIRDISSTGLYVVTEERWYPGTLVLMTLQRTDDGEEVSERSIAVMSRAVRWGEDGVGLQFILPKAQDPRRGDGVDRKTLEKFLQGLRGRKH